LLPEPERVMPVAPAAARAPMRWLWPGAAVALAAGLAIASWVVPKKPEPIPVQVVHAPPPLSPILPVEVLRPEPEVQAAAQPSVRSAMARTARPKRAVSNPKDYFLALDDEPIESGVIMRVAIGPGDAQADIVFDTGGRARAIRLVTNKY